MDGRPTWTDCDEAGDYLVPNVLSPRDLVFRPDNMDKTVPHHPDTRIKYKSATHNEPCHEKTCCLLFVNRPADKRICFHCIVQNPSSS